MHHWQDLVLSISLLAFNIALIPSVFGKQKPRLVTSAVTAAFLVPEILVFANLHLWYSLTMTSTNAMLWTIIAIQRFRQSKH
jgi:hypothetical protein